MAIKRFTKDNFEKREIANFKDADFIPIQGVELTEDMQYTTLSDLKNYFGGVEFPDAPETAISLLINSENPVYDIDNTMVLEGVPSDVPADIKVVASYFGAIRLFKLTDSNQNVNVTVYFDKTSTTSVQIQLFDSSNVLYSTITFEPNTVAALFYDINTDIWTVTSITSKATSEIYTYNPIGRTTDVKAPSHYGWYRNNILQFGSTSEGNIRFGVAIETQRLRKLVTTISTNTLLYNALDSTSDFFEIDCYYGSTSADTFTLNFDNINLRGRTFIFSFKNTTGYTITLNAISSVVTMIGYSPTVPNNGVGGFKVTILENYGFFTTI